MMNLQKQGMKNPAVSIKRHVILVGAVFLVLAFCIVPAMADDQMTRLPSQGNYKDISVTSTNPLEPGQEVNAQFTLLLPAGWLEGADTLKMGSSLINANWEIKVFRGTDTSQNPAATMTGTSRPRAPFKPSMFTLDYGDDTDVTLVVSLKGKVDANAGGTSITVLDIVCSNAKIGSYQSPAQKVEGENNTEAGNQVEVTNTPVPTEPTPVQPQGQYKDIVITPETTTTLMPGQEVTASFKVVLPVGSIRESDSIIFSSPLINTNWEVEVYKGLPGRSQTLSSTLKGTTSPNNSFRPSMFSIYFDDLDVTLKVTMKGKVSETADGTSLSVLEVRCLNPQIGKYVSPLQKVSINGEPEITETPTPTPTETEPTPTQTPAKSPLGILSIVAGLGAACAVMRRR